MADFRCWNEACIVYGKAQFLPGVERRIVQGDKRDDRQTKNHRCPDCGQWLSPAQEPLHRTDWS